MDSTDQAILNALQGGFPLSPRPYAAAAQAVGLEEDALLRKLGQMLRGGVLTRFGPMYDAERLGGAFTLCAMKIAAADFERVAAQVNGHPEVAHNYEREHSYNLWFVLATANPADIPDVISRIEEETGYPVLDLPREAEYFIELRLVA